MTSRRLLDPVARTLLDAADYIDEHGWCQGVSKDILGHVCAWYAIYRNTSATECIGANERLIKYLKLYAYHKAIPDWNDESGRTQAEVTAALRAAALAGELEMNLTEVK